MSGRFKYPPTRRSDGARLMHGTRVADPYDWLAAEQSPEITQWVEAQEALTDQLSGKTPERERIERWLMKLLSARHSFRVAERGKRLFFLRDEAGRDQPALFVRREPWREAQLLLDPATLAPGAAIMQQAIAPSPDGNYVALAFDISGSDAKRIILIVTESGKQIGGASPLTIVPTMAWHPDGSGFFYNRNQGAFVEAADRMAGPEGIYWHPVGSNFADDRLVVAKTWEEAHISLPSIAADGASLFVSEIHVTRKQSALSLVALSADGRPARDAEKLIAPGEGMAIHIGDAGDESFFQTDIGGLERGEIIAIGRSQPSRPAWRRVVAQQPDAMPMGSHGARSPNAIVFGQEIFVTLVHDAKHRVAVFDLAGRHLRDVPLPVVGSVAGFGGDRYGEMSVGGDGQSLLLELWTHTHRQLAARYRPAKDKVEWLFPAELDQKALAAPVRQVFYAGDDGTRIPMFLIGEARKGKAQPVLLYGYGGFGGSITPEFSPDIPAWLELGGLYAIANIRGGGEYGKAWHDAGRRHNKQTVFDDFAAAARFLIAEDFATPETLAIRGLSNGGLLTGALLVQHPELFGAVICELPLLDPLAMGGDAWSSALEPEIGNPVARADDFETIRRYSPLQNLVPGRHYPPTFVAAAGEDSPMLMKGARQFVATLQNEAGENGPYLLRIIEGCGHTGWPRSATARLIAEELTFFSKMLKAKFDFGKFPSEAPS